MLFYSYFKTLVGKEVRGVGGARVRRGCAAAALGARVRPAPRQHAPPPRARRRR